MLSIVESRGDADFTEKVCNLANDTPRQCPVKYWEIIADRLKCSRLEFGLGVSSE